MNDQIPLMEAVLGVILTNIVDNEISSAWEYLLVLFNRRVQMKPQCLLIEHIQLGKNVREK